jgi:Bacterial Ig-like domain/Bacterial Ig domain
MPTITGSCLAEHTVNLYIDNILSISTACIAGNFTLTVPTGLSDGSHVLSTTFSNSSGSASTHSPNLTLYIDTSLPARPTIATPTSGLPVNGTAEPGSSVTVTTPSGATCTVIADINGNYSCSLSPTPINGENITAITTDPSGNVSTPLTVNGWINVSLPWVPDLAGGSDTGASSNDNITTDTTPTITGTCTSGQTIHIYVDNILVGTTSCNNGNYTFTITTPISNGTHAISTTFVNPNGQETGHSPNLNITIDTSVPVSPTIATPTNGSPVSGTAEPGSSVTVTTPSGATCTVIADINGNYSCSLSPTPVNGENITAITTDPSGNLSAPFTVNGGINTSTPSVPDLTNVSDTGISNTDNITTDTTPTVTGTCTNSQTVNLYIDNILATSVVCTSGTFTLTAPTALWDGNHAISTSFITSGNESTRSPALNVTIDTSTPSDPTVNAPTNGSPITWTAEPGSTVVVTTPSGATCTALANVSGNYSCSLTPNPVHGEDITVIVTDPSGNSANPFIVVRGINTSSPDAPDLTSASDTGISHTDNITTETSPTVTGTCTNGATMKIYVDNILNASAICSGEVYTITLDPSLTSW